MATTVASAFKSAKRFMFGHNPNYPFPALKGKEDRGLIGELIGLLTLWNLGILVGVVTLLRPDITVGAIGMAYDLGYRWKSTLQAKFLADEVEPNVFVRTTFQCSERYQQSLVDVIQKDYRRVREAFGFDLDHPIIIEISPNSEIREDGLTRLGHYGLQSHSSWGYHRISVSVEGLKRHNVVSHELTHAYVDHINPDTTPMMHEGLAHYMEKENQIQSELVRSFVFPVVEHWIPGMPKSVSDSQTSRATAWAVVHYLATVKKIPVAKIPTLSPKELPSALEVRAHMGSLTLEDAKATAIRATSESGLSTDLFTEAYLTSTRLPDSDLSIVSGTLAEARNELEALMHMTIWHLRKTGKTDEDLRKLSTGDLLQLSREAKNKLADYLKDFGLKRGKLAYILAGRGGIADEHFARLLKGDYPKTLQGNLTKATDEGWARYFAFQRKSGLTEVPDFSPTVMEIVRQNIDGLSPLRSALYRLQMQGSLQDLTPEKTKTQPK